MVAKVKRTKRTKTLKHRKGKSMKRRKGKTMKRGKKRKTMRRGKKGKKTRGRTMRGGFVNIIKDALVPLLFTASVVKRGKKKTKRKSRSRK